MGEALLSRSTTIPEEVLDPIYPTPGICSILLTVKDSLNYPAVNMMVNCKDGPSWYNYITNEKGQVLFSTNSGSANISIINKLANGAIVLDQKEMSIDIAAPTSTVIRNTVTLTGYADSEEINFTTPGSDYHVPYFINGGQYTFLVSSKIDLFLGGGGGGGGASGRSTTGGTGGGAGGAILRTNVPVNKGEVYTGYLGSGGAAGRQNYDFTVNEPAGSGGTTSFMSYSAAGGAGGTYGGAAGGGDYATGGQSQSSALPNFGGGGGRCRVIESYYSPSGWSNLASLAYKGNPGGGAGSICWDDTSDGQTSRGQIRAPTAGTSGLGGGGGGSMYSYGWSTTYGAAGGSGTIRIKMYR